MRRFLPNPRRLRPLILRPQACGLGELPVALVKEGEAGFILGELLVIPGGLAFMVLPLASPCHLQGTL